MDLLPISRIYCTDYGVDHVPSAIILSHKVCKLSKEHSRDKHLSASFLYMCTLPYHHSHKVVCVFSHKIIPTYVRR